MSKTYLNSSSKAMNLNTVIPLQEAKYDILLDILVSITTFLGIPYKKLMSNGSLVPISANKTAMAAKVPPTKEWWFMGINTKTISVPILRSFLNSDRPSLVNAGTLASAESNVVWWRQYNLVPCNLIYVPVLIQLFFTDIIFKRYFQSSQHTTIKTLDN